MSFKTQLSLEKNPHKHEEVSSKGQLSRRDFIIIGGLGSAAILGLAGGIWKTVRALLNEGGDADGQREKPSSPTDADRAFKDFPREIEGAEVENLVETPGSKYCLAHIGQIHGTDLTPLFKKINEISPFVSPELAKKFNDLLVELQELITKSQQEYAESAFKIVNELKQKTGLTSIRLEGVYLDNEAMIWQYAKLPFMKPETGLNQEELNVLREVINDLSETEIVAKERWEGFLAASPDAQRNFIEEIFFIAFSNYGVGLLIAKERLLGIKAAEKSGIRSDTDFQNHLNNLDLREDDLLEIIQDGKDPLVVIIFGNDHHWENNIKQWNSKNPKDKFSLIKITPLVLASIEKKFQAFLKRSDELLEEGTEEIQKKMLDNLNNSDNFGKKK